MSPLGLSFIALPKSQVIQSVPSLSAAKANEGAVCK